MTNEEFDPTPQGDLAMQITALPRDTNGFGDIYGGWLVAQMDLAGTAMASRLAGGRVATQTQHIGRSSVRILVEVWSDDPQSEEWRKVTEAVFVFVAIDDSRRTRAIPASR